MKYIVKPSKDTPLFTLKKGDVITVNDKAVAFKEWNRGGRSFSGMVLQGELDGQLRKITMNPNAMSAVVIGQFEFEEVVSEIDQLRKSSPGTLFAIANKKATELFRLVEVLPSGKVRGESPLTGMLFNIDSSFAIKLIENLG